MARCTAVFLAATAATTLTGFLFPIHGLTPALALGLLCLPLLALALFARYPRRLAGPWRWLYAVTAMLLLYFNVFVLVVQAFLKVPALKSLAPTQSEPPFAATQLAVLVLFLAATIAAAIRFRPQMIRSTQVLPLAEPSQRATHAVR